MTRLVALPLILIAILLPACVTTQPDGANESLTDAELAANNAEKDYDSLIAAGDEAFARDDLDAAQLNYALAVNRNSDTVSGLYKLGIVHYRKQSYEIATRILSRVIELPEAPANAFETLGFISLINERYDQAESHFMAALSRQPARWRSLNGLGVLHDMQSQHTDAQSYFRRALLLSPTNERVVNNLGYSMYLEGRYKEAQAQFLTASRLNPNYQKAWSNLGLSFVRQGRYNEARAAFSKVADTHVVSNNLGYLGLLQGDRHIAKQEFKAAIQASPVFYKIANENLALLHQQENGVTQPSIATRNTTAKRQSLVQSPPLKAPALGDSSAGDSSGERSAKKPQHTMDLKTAKLYLNFLGYQSTQSTADSGSSLTQTIINFQAGFGLEASGIIDKNTRALIETETQKRLDSFLAMQGYYSDDTAAPALPSALRRFKKDNGLVINDSVDEPTLNRISSLNVAESD